MGDTTKQEPEVAHPEPADVLFGRGHRVNNARGNIFFRKLIQERLEEFMTIPYIDARNTVVRQVIEEVEEEGGRFLREKTGWTENSGGEKMWVLAEREMVLSKVKQAFRDASKLKQGKRKRLAAAAAMEQQQSLARKSSVDLRHCK